MLIAKSQLVVRINYYHVSTGIPGVATSNQNRCGLAYGGGGTLAQLPIILSPPALRIAVVKDGAGVVSSSRNGHGRPARAEVNRCGGRCCCVRVSCMLCSTVAQLSVVIPSPTLQVAVVKDGAGMVKSSRNRNGCATSTEVNRCGRRGVGVRVGSTVAQLSLVVPSPTLQVAVVKDGTGVGRTSRYRNGRAARAEINRCG